MSRGISRVALLAALGACTVAVLGCSDDGASDEGSQAVDGVVESWGELAARDAEQTRAYLSGEGQPLTRYADFAADLDQRLDDAAYADQCGDLRAEWAEAYPRRDLLEWLYALPDPILGRLWTSQIPAAERALDACAAGDEGQGAELVEQVIRVQELIDRRLEQLDVDR